jgi:isocitrate dehydrogenase
VAGIDIFVESGAQPGDIASAVQSVLPPWCRLTLISNRGTQVWPTGSLLTDCVNQHRLRIEISGEKPVNENDMLKVALLVGEKARVCSTEMLMRYDGAAAYSMAQGQ